VFKDTGNKPPLGHVTDSKCKPDITAAFDKYWQDDITLWPCVRLAGEKASAGKSKEEQKKQAVSYLHYLLLARPDLLVAQWILIDDERVSFLVGIGGVGIRSVSVTWKSSNLPKLICVFIYRLYKPGDFADHSFVDMKPDVPKNSVEYTVRITPQQTNAIDCPGFFHLFASSPFGTRTHVLTNPSSEVQVNGQALTALKDQLCRSDTRFDEQSILNHIHQPVRVPGVVEVVHSQIIKTRLSEGRQKYRLGLRQSGSPFMSIPTVRKMLETLFDVLEGNFYSIDKRRSTDKFTSAAVFAFRAQGPPSGYKQRQHFVFTPTKHCSRCPHLSRSGCRRRLPLLHQVSPWRGVCICKPGIG
jgi:hypothetical protein